jgi:hypothetical protein
MIIEQLTDLSHERSCEYTVDKATGAPRIGPCMWTANLSRENLSHPASRIEKPARSY